MIEHALARSEVTEVVATTEEGNAASVRVLDKCGLTFVSRTGSEAKYAVRSL